MSTVIEEFLKNSSENKLHIATKNVFGVILSKDSGSRLYLMSLKQKCNKN